jgi:L-asparaginase
MGVLVVMDDRLISARENRKIYPRAGGFSTGEMGMLGVMSGSGPEFFFAPVRKHGAQTDFDVASIETLPQVELTYSYPGGVGFRPADDTQGLVVATTGFSPTERSSFDEIRKKGVVLVQAFPSGENVPGRSPDRALAPAGQSNQGGGPRFDGPPSIFVQHLLPQKARILLMLALTKTRDPREIQRYFNEY